MSKDVVGYDRGESVVGLLVPIQGSPIRIVRSIEVRIGESDLDKRLRLNSEVEGIMKECEASGRRGEVEIYNFDAELNVLTECETKRMSYLCVSKLGITLALVGLDVMKKETGGYLTYNVSDGIRTKELELCN